jgi:hypothetical protein
MHVPRLHQSSSYLSNLPTSAFSKHPSGHVNFRPQASELRTGVRVAGCGRGEEYLCTYVHGSTLRRQHDVQSTWNAATSVVEAVVAALDDTILRYCMVHGAAPGDRLTGLSLDDGPPAWPAVELAAPSSGDAPVEMKRTWQLVYPCTRNTTRRKRS